MHGQGTWNEHCIMTETSGFVIPGSCYTASLWFYEAR